MTIMGFISENTYYAITSKIPYSYRQTVIDIVKYILGVN